MAARGEGALEVARETLGIAEVFSVFTYKGVECWPRHARVGGVAGAARRGGGCLRTAGFSSVIIAEQQQSDDPTLVYGTLRVVLEVFASCRDDTERIREGLRVSHPRCNPLDFRANCGPERFFSLLPCVVNFIFRSFYTKWNVDHNNLRRAEVLSKEYKSVPLFEANRL